MEVTLGAIHEFGDSQQGELAIGAPPPPIPTPRQSWALMMAREYTIEEMLYQPCRLHNTAKNPARHLLKDFHMWNFMSHENRQQEMEVDELAENFSTLYIHTTVDKKDEK